MSFATYLKAVAVGGILTMWAKLTIEAFNLSWHIITTSPEDEPKVVKKAKCEICADIYDDDDFDVIIGRCLCLQCREP